MSCLRLRLPPARRAWKSLTSKLQSKLHKPKGITKPRNRVKAITTTASSSAAFAFASASVRLRLRPYKFLQLRFKRRGRLALRCRYNRPQLLQNRSTAHVYVDKLFKEPAVTDQQVECSQPPVAKSKQTAAAVTELVEDSQPPVAKCMQSAAAASGSGATRACTVADDAWESVGFASPLMHGIDERAEEFIARFRKEMKVQEKLARDHL